MVLYAIALVVLYTELVNAYSVAIGFVLTIGVPFLVAMHLIRPIADRASRRLPLPVAERRHLRNPAPGSDPQHPAIAGDVESGAEAARTVAVAFHEPVVGVAEVAMLRVLSHLEARGWRFVFWTPGPGPLRDELFERGYDVAGEPPPAALQPRRAPRATRTRGQAAERAGLSPELPPLARLA